jgi:hypothetical protein
MLLSISVSKNKLYPTLLRGNILVNYKKIPSERVASNKNRANRYAFVNMQPVGCLHTVR